MNKQKLFFHCNQKISKTCIVDDQTETGSYMIQGKYCWIQPAFSYGEDVWEIWIGNPFDQGKGLSMRRVRNIALMLDKHWLEGSYLELNGEAVGRVQGTDAVLNNLGLLGIRKKRELSPEAVEKMTARLAASKGDKP